MIKPTTKNAENIFSTLLQLGFAPWEYPTDVAWQKVAATYNVHNPDDQLSPEAIRARYRRIIAWLEDNDFEAEEYVNSLVQPNREITTYVGESSDIDSTPTVKVSGPEELIKAVGLDPRFYEPSTGKISNWGNGSSSNWAVSTVFKRRDVPDSEVLDYIVAAVNKVEAPPYNLETPAPDPEGVLCVLSIYDVHLEKVEVDGSWKQKLRDYHVAVMDLASRVRNVAQFVVPFGNDFGNFDNIQGETTKGTPQENSVNWQTAIDMRVNLLIWTVETLSEIAPVHVIFVPGNHDRLTTYFLGKVLEARYGEDTYITVDNGHGTRKYYLWNQVGLMFTHGSEEKLAELPMIFATEGGEVFAPATHREIHTGDKHGRVVSEKFGVITRILPSLSGPDNWHMEKGYVQNGRAAMALTYSHTRLESELLCYV